MKVYPKVEMKMDGFDKCALVCDNDVSLGSLYDYACALRGFIYAKIQEVEAQQAQNEKPKED